MKRFIASLSVLAMVLNFVPLSPAKAAAVAVPPAISISSITDANGIHTSPYDFSCDLNPLFGSVSVTGNGVGSAPPGDASQYAVQVDWGDGVIDNGLGVFTPNSGHVPFSFTFTDGPHTYSQDGQFVIHARLYHQTPSGNDNDADSAVTVSTCVVVIPPGTGIVNVTKALDNAGIGTKSEDDFTASVTDVNGSGTPFALSATAIPVTVTEGAYSVLETADPAYTTTYSPECTGTIAAQEVKDCTITNTYIAPTTGTLHVVKNLVQNNGGTATVSDFRFHVDGGSDFDFEADGQNDLVLTAGTYSISELVTLPGYTTTYDNCTNVVVPAGGEATCTITNDDIAPTLTVVKVVLNNSGGQAVVSDFPLFVDGNSVTSDDVNTFDVGAHTVTELNNLPYAGSFSGDCDSNGVVILTLGENETCTITNDDIAPPPPTEGHLIIRKVVVGGAALVTDFSYGLQVNSAPAVDANFEVGGTQVTLQAGDTYEVLEHGATDYSTTEDAGCGGTIVGGQDVVCTVTNTYTGPVLPLACVPGNIVENGSFENPDATTNAANGNLWDIFADGFAGLIWHVTGLDGVSPVSGLELQHGFSGWLSSNGSQFAELDGNEPTAITQNVTTVPGQTYTLTFDLSARPDTALENNAVEVYWNNVSQGIFNPPAAITGQTAWNTITVPNLLATSTNGTLELVDRGVTADSLGSFVDNVNLSCGAIIVQSTTATVTVITHFDNSNGTGTLTDDHDADNTLDFITDSATVQNHNGAEAPGFDVTVQAGSYTVTADDVAGYSKQFIGDCDTTITAGQTLTCTVEFDDLPLNPPSVEVHPTLLCVEPSLQDSDILIAHFGYTSNNVNTVSVPIGVQVAMDNRFSGGGLVADMGQPVNFDPGSFPDVVQVPFDSAFTITWFLTSNPAEASSQSPLCPSVTPGTLTVRTFVVNDEGGTMSPDEVGITVSGVNPSTSSFNGSEAGTVVTLDPGSYSADGPDIDDYTKTLSAGCLGTIAADDALTCDITYADDFNQQGGGAFNGSGSTGNGGGSTPSTPGTPTPPAPVVLGDSDEVTDPGTVILPTPPPVVLGATDEQLPRTGVPVSGLMAIGSMLTFLVRRKQK